jgi:hypothetical protein
VVDACDATQNVIQWERKEEKSCTNPSEKSCWRVPKAETTGMDNSIVLKRALLCGRELIVIVAILGRASARPVVQKGRK